MNQKFIVIWFDMAEERYREAVIASNKEEARSKACQSHPERNNLQMTIITEGEL